MILKGSRHSQEASSSTASLSKTPRSRSALTGGDRRFGTSFPRFQARDRHSREAIRSSIFVLRFLFLFEPLSVFIAVLRATTTFTASPYHDRGGTSSSSGFGGLLSRIRRHHHRHPQFRAKRDPGFLSFFARANANDNT